MDDNLDEEIELVEDARDAMMIKGLITPYINKKINALLELSIGEYRGGHLDYNTILGRVAEISALKALLSDLDSTERRGQSAMERRHGKDT